MLMFCLQVALCAGHCSLSWMSTMWILSSLSHLHRWGSMEVSGHCGIHRRPWVLGGTEASGHLELPFSCQTQTIWSGCSPPPCGLISTGSAIAPGARNSPSATIGMVSGGCWTGASMEKALWRVGPAATTSTLTSTNDNNEIFHLLSTYYLTRHCSNCFLYVYHLIVSESIVWCRDQQNFSVKGQMVNTIGFVGHTVSLTTTWLCCYSVKAV